MIILLEVISNMFHSAGRAVQCVPFKFLELCVETKDGDGIVVAGKKVSDCVATIAANFDNVSTVFHQVSRDNVAHLECFSIKIPPELPASSDLFATRQLKWVLGVHGKSRTTTFARTIASPGQAGIRSLS